MSARRAAARRSELGGVHVLADASHLFKWDPVEQARAACAGGARVVQLRAKESTDREILGWSREIRELTRASGLQFFVNDRFDLALAAGADGVHLGQNDLAPDRIPPAARASLLVGRSTHDPDQVTEAIREGVDYVAFGPIFATATKATTTAPQGLAALEACSQRAAPCPVIAIGGIDVARAPALIRAGAAGIAVISAVASSDDPEVAVRALVRAVAGENRT